MSEINPSMPTTALPEFGMLLPADSWMPKNWPVLIPLALASASRFPGMINPALDTRNHLPEPIDVPDHIGNMAMTFMILDRVSSIYWGRNTEALTQAEYDRKHKVFALSIGILSVVANVVAEKVGYGKYSTPDPVDFIYGCLGGALAYKLHKPHYTSPDMVSLISGMVEPDDRVLALFERAIARRQAQRPPSPHVPNSLEKPPAQTVRKVPTSLPRATPARRHDRRTKLQKQSRQQNRRRK